MPKKNRWDYLNDYKKNESGKYEYKGAYYGFGGAASDRRGAYIRLWLMLILISVSSIASGCLDGAGITNTFYVIIPYIGEICCLFALAWYHFKLLTKGDKVKAYVFKSAHPKIPIAAMLLAFFAIAGFLCSLLFSVLSGFDGFKAIAYLALKSLSAAAALIYRNYFNKLEWIEL